MEFKELQVKLNERLKEREEEIIELRRHFHQNPELSFEEKETSKYIQDFYKDKDCTVRPNFGDGYGIVVDIEGGKPGKTIALRADMDALPIEEDTGLDFASKNPGVMHACGHDGHTAYLMILADTLIELKEHLPGNVRIIHQPAEEQAPGGAKGMVEAGCLEGVDHIMAIHFITDIELGTIGYREGATQTGRASFDITIEGKGGHGAAPHDAIDSIVGASYFVTSLQTIVSRRLNPFDNASVTIGSFDGKGGRNVIKHSVELQGDIRLMQEENREFIENEFKKVLEGICKAFNLKYDLNYMNDYPVLVNDGPFTNMVVRALEETDIESLEKLTRIKPQNPSEDFSYYLQEVPGSMFYVGATKKGDTVYPHHHPNFDINEESLLIAARAVGNSTLHYLFKGING